MNDRERRTENKEREKKNVALREEPADCRGGGEIRGGWGWEEMITGAAKERTWKTKMAWGGERSWVSYNRWSRGIREHRIYLDGPAEGKAPEDGQVSEQE